MQQFGVCEAKTKLPDLIRQVLASERVTITNRGVAVVDLVPSTQFTSHRTEIAIAAIKSLRARSSIARTASIDRATFTALREQGRRCSAKTKPAARNVG